MNTGCTICDSGTLGLHRHSEVASDTDSNREKVNVIDEISDITAESWTTCIDSQGSNS